MASIFTRIIKGEIPCYKIAEDERYFAFLDINPLSKGHTLVVPKQEVDYIFDLDQDTYTGLMLFAQKVALVIGTSVPCLRVGVAVIGLEVPHAHVHLIPLHSGSINFSDPKLKLEKEEFERIAQAIRSNI
ncbi:MAG: HIT family protein [Bacteroidetes bacterium]|nr:HIT family protein [Bacteroidota bacterium]